ncbi:MAG: hypothetical protein A3B74_01360 [Candidatus Kerfeldbacteria bacterium RIFCSPHIGHO2_02_FULL_42_14]|uniref:Uncharacterized protein n=1 Tax=Candidatus Kerfeldbacteria bacterium RIFCSPHIGHO2_02_FULL_42_14 TaxID=1798540 RepID=A0A1G2ASY2_9BACT|nr:MAG: hypothetical protein A3B74_01360 [Candidatus Kerfeldbacteria bacterium RIFCSPHIGHO2_02_FULL_42_14]OGY81207.1 MAG: hypothetical protein A3E60_02875 [Candidatus Kerfeldbacteria bacterium RIFCSPHIGHO2_12_FULL_42_13]OGY83373.1 MAG: hypothetical protein A3I91_01835 [Candidatus Kerfeldbacteria bacterium RIFCSPLOWO2_02_FULL_42_19]OGY86365.1 MAG: hypothetical protein A3G01_05205 [Candidatus Kerfeldbacteria bacterium RIFCSPLOWO2_12_FULL_43_9]
MEKSKILKPNKGEAYKHEKNNHRENAPQNHKSHEQKTDPKLIPHKKKILVFVLRILLNYTTFMIFVQFDGILAQ